MARKTLSEAMEWRYATKKMDPERPVSQDKVDAIVEAIRMAPTSSGTQPFELFVITNSETRAKIRKAAKGQAQVTDGSHLLVFAAWDDYTEERINDVAELNVAARGESPLIRHYYENLKQQLLPLSPEQSFAHAARQAYIALGFGLLAAADLEVDSTPMEGFDPAAVDAILELGERGLRSAALMALGHRDPAGDWLLHMKKVRKPSETIINIID